MQRTGRLRCSKDHPDPRGFRHSSGRSRRRFLFKRMSRAAVLCKRYSELGFELDSLHIDQMTN